MPCGLCVGVYEGDQSRISFPLGCGHVTNDFAHSLESILAEENYSSGISQYGVGIAVYMSYSLTKTPT